MSGRGSGGSEPATTAPREARLVVRPGARAQLPVADHPVNGPSRRAHAVGDVAGRAERGDVVRAAVEHHDVGVGAVGDLRLVAGAGLANGQAVGERARPVRPADELASAARRGLRSGRAPRPRTSFSEPSIGHQNSSASVWTTQSAPSSVGREAGHVGHPPRTLLAVVHVGRPDHGEQAGFRVAGEDVHRLVGGAVVGDDEVVDAERVMEAQVVLEDVSLVPDLVRHRDAHRGLSGPASAKGGHCMDASGPRSRC